MDITKAVYEALLKEAQIYFSEISSKFPAGTYTCKQAKELMLQNEVLQEVVVHHKHNDYDTKNKFYKEWHYSQENNGYDITVLNSKKIITIEIENFRTSFDACKVFDYLEAYKKLAKVKGDILFTVAEEMETSMEFQFELKKEYKNLLKYVADDELRPVMQYVALHIANQELVASDRYKLAVYPVEIKNLTKDNGDYSESVIQLPSDIFRKCSGTVTVSVSKDFKKIIVSDTTGKVFSQDYIGRYPNYRNVLYPVVKDAFVDLDTDSVKSLTAFAKQIVKSYKYMTDLTFQFEKDSSELKVSYIDIDFEVRQDRTFNLLEKCTFDLNIRLDAKNLICVFNDWNGRIWLKGCSRSVYFDGKNKNLSLLMPKLIDDDFKLYDDITGETIDIYTRPEAFKPEKLDLGKEVKSANMETAGQAAPVAVPVPEETPVLVADDVKPVCNDAETMEAVSVPESQTDSHVQPEIILVPVRPTVFSFLTPFVPVPGVSRPYNFLREVAALHIICAMMILRYSGKPYIYTGNSVKIRGSTEIIIKLFCRYKIKLYICIRNKKQT